MKNRVVEAAVMTGKAPLLIDVDVLGLLYLGNVRVDADPFTIFKRNLTTLRVERRLSTTSATLKAPTAFPACRRSASESQESKASSDVGNGHGATTAADAEARAAA